MREYEVEVVSGMLTLGQGYSPNGKLKLREVEPSFSLPAPDDVQAYLHESGWSLTGNSQWRKNNESYQEFTWEQAMAREFLRFITLKDKGESSYGESSQRQR